MKKIIALILLLVLVTTSLSSCKSNGFTSCKQAGRTMDRRHR
jgi:predicted small secreted protein